MRVQARGSLKFLVRLALLAFSLQRHSQLIMSLRGIGSQLGSGPQLGYGPIHIAQTQQPLA